jgi:Uma2 family endonuclease
MLSVATAEVLDPQRITLEAWAQMDEDAPGELVDGRLVEEEVARNLHEVPVSWFVGTLGNWAIPRGGWVLGSEHKLGIAEGRGRKPDVSMYPPGARLRANERLSRTPPAVVVEVISPSPKDAHRDRVEKLADYARFGVRWYWLLDPRTRILEILELGADGRYAIAASASGGQVAVPGCEGLTLELDGLWAEVDTLSFDGEDEDEAAPSS